MRVYRNMPPVWRDADTGWGQEEALLQAVRSFGGRRLTFAPIAMGPNSGLADMVWTALPVSSSVRFLSQPSS